MPAKGKRERTCFVICPIGKEDTDVRKRSDEVLKYIVGGALDECGYKVVRSDEISGSGVITVDIVEHLYRDDLVIADLTDRNPNVFYELGIRHAFRKPCVQIVHKDTEIPFDVAQVRTIRYDHQNLTSANRAKEDLVQAVRAAEAGNRPSITPVAIAESVLSLRTDASSSDKLLSQILELLLVQNSAMGEILSKQRYGSPDRIDYGSFENLRQHILGDLTSEGFGVTTGLGLPGRSLVDWIVTRDDKPLAAVWFLGEPSSLNMLAALLDAIGKSQLRRVLVIAVESLPWRYVHKDAVIYILGIDYALTHRRSVFEILTSENPPELPTIDSVFQ